MHQLATIHLGKYRILILLTILLTSLFLPGCAGKEDRYTRDGIRYGITDGGFRGQWWEYYERGKSFSDGRFYTEAAGDFRKAIAGHAQDQWQAETDGTRSLDYFPHRELGIIYFFRKEYDLAISELETSIRGASSAKAHYFMNKARAEKLRLQGSDMAPPLVFLDGSSGKRLTNSFTQVVKGVAEDDTFVASVKVGETTLPQELAEKRQLFSAEVPLAEGENFIRITATDLAGKTTDQDLEVYCDRGGPIVEILDTETEGERKVYHGVVSDAGGMKSLRINGEPWRISGKFQAYNFRFALPEGGVTLVATDKAGNVTTALFNEDDAEEDPLLTPLLAYLEPSTPRSFLSPVASDANESPPASSQTPQPDTDPPFIMLEDRGPEEETYKEYVLLQGMVTDLSPIQNFSVNGKPFSIKNGRKLYFSQMMKLHEGENEFLIAAADSQGNRSERRIILRRKIKNIRKLDSRMSVAVLPFEHRGEVSSSSELIYDRIIKSFQEQKRFNIVERKKIDSALEGLDVHGTDLADPDKTASLGKKMAADALLTGTVVESPDSVEVIGRLIDADTAAILSRKDIYGEKKSPSSVDSLLEDLAFKFTRDFPIFEGILMEVRDKEVLVDLGAAKQVRPNLHLICYREGLDIKHPITGKIIDAEPEILGELTVTEVFEDHSRATLKDKSSRIQVYDRVIAK